MYYVLLSISVLLNLCFCVCASICEDTFNHMDGVWFCNSARVYACVYVCAHTLTSEVLTRPSWKEQSLASCVHMCRYLHQLQENVPLTQDRHLERVRVWKDVRDVRASEHKKQSQSFEKKNILQHIYCGTFSLKVLCFPNGKIEETNRAPVREQMHSIHKLPWHLQNVNCWHQLPQDRGQREARVEEEQNSMLWRVLLFCFPDGQWIIKFTPGVFHFSYCLKWTELSAWLWTWKDMCMER